MTEQAFQLKAQYPYGLLRVLGFLVVSFLVFSLLMIASLSIFPESLMLLVFILSCCLLVIFLVRYTEKVGKYHITLNTALEGMHIIPHIEVSREKTYLWTDLKSYRMIRPKSGGAGFYNIIYVKWQNGDAHHFSGQDVTHFYQYLELNFPEKEWRFLGAPKKIN